MSGILSDSTAQETAAAPVVQMDETLRQSGPSENERGGDATVSAPRRRAPSPISTRQDPKRPFAYKRQSSGFTSFINSIASPTSEMRTRPATPAESATRSTFFTGPVPAAVSDLPTSTPIPVFSTSPMSTHPPVELPVAPALQLRGPSPLPDNLENRPKGQGTLELERVLGMWAAKTATSSSFSSLPPLPGAPSASLVASGSSAPLFAQAVVTAEPESLDLASSAQQAPGTASASSSISSVFADFAQLAALQPTASASRDRLELPRPPRRQRSKSEADIMNIDFSNFESISMNPSAQGAAESGSSQLQLDLGRGPFLSPPQGHALSNALSFPDTMALSDALQLQSYNLALRVPPSQPHRKHTGGPGYREAALLDLSGEAERGRRARSHCMGHRRSAKSDDFTHLLSPSVATTFAESGTYATANGHLASPGGGTAAPAAGPSPSALPPFSTGSPAGQSGAGHSPQVQHQVYYVPNGQSVPIQVAYLASTDPVTGQSMLTPVPPPQATPQAQPHQPQQQPALYPPRQAIHAQYSPQSNALALAAAQAAQAHAASVAQAAVSAAAAASTPYANGAANGQRRSSADRLGVASVPGSGHSPGLSPAGASPYGVSSPVYPYRSPVALGLPGLPIPPAPSDGPSPGSGSGRSAAAGGTRKRSRASAVAAAAALKREKHAHHDDHDERDAHDDEAEEDAEMHEGASDEEGAEYIEHGEFEPLVRAPVSANGRKKATGGAAKKGIKTAARTSSNTDDDEDEFTKESKTTQATIDAAKRRRNAGAVAKFVCELCGETFTRRYNLRGHQRAHKGEKPYKCSHDDCDKSFARAHDCKRHELLHLGVRKYNCAPCKRDFVRLDALHRHHRSEVGQECVKQLQADGAKFDDKGAQIL